MTQLTKSARRLRVRRRVRKVVKGTAVRPRLAVFRSNKEIYAQLIDDVAGKTVAAASSLQEKSKGSKKSEAAALIGKQIAEKAKKLEYQKLFLIEVDIYITEELSHWLKSAREAGLKF